MVIAHRLSTIRNAHQIAVLHQGRLREVRYRTSVSSLSGEPLSHAQVGSHSELLAKGKFYKELIRRQTVLE